MTTRRQISAYLAEVVAYERLFRHYGEDDYRVTQKLEDLERMAATIDLNPDIHEAIWVENGPVTMTELDDALGGNLQAYYERSDGRVSSSTTGRPATSGRKPAQPGPGRGRKQKGRGQAKSRSRSRRLLMSRPAFLVYGVIIIVAGVLVFRQSPTLPPSVQWVQAHALQACQVQGATDPANNIPSQPDGVNFACDKESGQVLWIFAAMTSGDVLQYSDPKSGRVGLEPLTPAQGGQVAWSLNLHHPYNPYDPMDSLQVAARAINNIVGGATLTSAKGGAVVQPGLLSSPANCQRYTGSSAMSSRAGYPSLCAMPLSKFSRQGLALLAGDAFKQWVVGATKQSVGEVKYLFSHADQPGDAKVQGILANVLPQPSSTPAALGGGQGRVTNAALGSARKNSII